MHHAEDLERSISDHLEVLKLGDLALDFTLTGLGSIHHTDPICGDINLQRLDMDAYPAEYIRHELPLIALSGLGHFVEPSTPAPSSSWNPSPGAAIDRELGDVSVTFSRALRDEFFRADGTSFTWNGAGNPQRPGLMGFRFSAVGQRFVFPRRKAAPAAQAPSEDASNAPASIAPHELHSTLSPLSPTSPLFPDGLLSTVWMNKHQHDVPAVFLCCVDISDDASTASLRDNHIKNEISRLKQALARSGYRTKLAVAILSDNSGGDIDERIAAVKRISGLDGRTSFFSLTRPASKSDIFDFVGSVLTALQPLCIDYYRDLTKHSRRKNNRGYIPSPFGSTASGTSQSLSNSGWRARYEFKQGVFAEFRQEMDVAERHYAFALDELLNAEGVLETTPVWTSRWEEARCIADITALRILRCQLWRSSTTAAADFWTNHRERIRSLVDRRGKGSSTYGFAAWESRWAQIMAELVNRAHIPAFEIQRIVPERTSEEGAEEEEFVIVNISAPPEKAFVGAERLPPFHYLHHPGYWYRMACRWALERYQRVKSIPEEDRKPPRQSDGAQNKESPFDTYMVSPPHIELPPGSLTNEKAEALILALSQRAEDEFEKRRQFRMRSLLAMQRSHMLSEGGAQEKALHALLAIWNDMAWRTEGWWDLAGEVIFHLYALAEKTGNPRLMSELKWEMICTVFGDKFSKSLGNISTTETGSSISLSLDVRTRLSPVSARFCFASKEGHVGDVVACQVTLTYGTTHSQLLVIKSVIIILNGGAIKIRLTHDEAAQRSLSQALALKDAASNTNDQTKSYESHANLDLNKDSANILNFDMPLREVGEIEISEMTIEMSMGSDIARYIHRGIDLATTSWLLPDGDKLVSTSLDRETSTLIDVLPKPPKVHFQLADAHPQYFTSEDVVLSIVLSNEENSSVQGSLRINCSEELLRLLDFKWDDSSTSPTTSSSPSMTTGSVETGAQKTFKATFKALSDPTNVTLPFSIDYFIGDEKDTKITKTATFHISFVTPIEAKFDLSPRLDTQQWPSFFTLPPVVEGQTMPEGIRQQWILSVRLNPAAQEGLVLENMSLAVNKAGESILCEIPTPSKAADPVSLSTDSTHNEVFTIFTQRRTLDDRRPAPLSLDLLVSWRRNNPGSSASNTTTISVPTLQMPPAEPRVLCTAIPASDEPYTTIVTYTLENPSMHFLTFALTMEAADHFAFAGPKMRSLALTPLSRAEVVYKVMLLDTEGAEKGKGKWVYPVLRVTDSYFNKTLRVVPASEGVRGDDRKGDGVAVWVPIE